MAQKNIINYFRSTVTTTTTAAVCEQRLSMASCIDFLSWVGECTLLWSSLADA